jgi:hypothetical protein
MGRCSYAIRVFSWWYKNDNHNTMSPPCLALATLTASTKGLASSLVWVNSGDRSMQPWLGRAALIAVARKLTTILNAILRDRCPWQPIRA